jgi:alpha-beta hydrolase superfamily lysophospholipase
VSNQAALRPRLIDTRVPRRPEGVVLVLHGGGSRGESVRVSPTQLSVLRMLPIAGRIATRGGGRLAVFRLLNSVRGWSSGHPPVHDVEWALEQVRKRLGELPACLVGHSLGGRAAILASGAPAVRSVAALAPWVYPADGDVETSGRSFLIVHGTDDRIADPEKSVAVARRLQPRNSVGYVQVRGGSHAMLRRQQFFDGLATEFTLASLLERPFRSELLRRAFENAEPIAV